MSHLTKLIPSRALVVALLVTVGCVLLPRSSSAQVGTWRTQSHDARHTAVSSVKSQPLSAIHWSVPVDLDPPTGEIFIHYGSPLITALNTVIVPVKTGANSFRVEAHEGATGTLLWTQNTGYQAPSAGFMPALGSTLLADRLFVPDLAGRVLVRQNPDSAKGQFAHLYFYGQNNFQADPQVYERNVQINTPLTTDAHGNLFFGFLVLGSTPIGLQSGLARIAPDGTGTWVSAAAISGDPAITKVAMSCAPALSADGSTLYVAVDNQDFGFGYLVALNSTTLAVVNHVRLTDPSSGLDATFTDETSATPTVGPDGDVYFGVLENPFPSHNDRGWMLHFNSDLSVQKIPGSFGWDDTASIVNASLVPSYQGTSKYLLMTKYNNYAGINTGDGHNTAVVDPFTKSVMVNSEDGKLYRWNLATNQLSERITLSGGIGEAYTPTVIGSDGTVYGINDAVLSAIGQ